MNRTIIIALSVVVLVLVGCGQKAAPPAGEPALPSATSSDQAAQTGNEEVDAVAEDIDGVSQIDAELDDSDLEGLEDTLSDIENI